MKKIKNILFFISINFFLNSHLNVWVHFLPKNVFKFKILLNFLAIQIKKTLEIFDSFEI